MDKQKLIFFLIAFILIILTSFYYTSSKLNAYQIFNSLNSANTNQSSTSRIKKYVFIDLGANNGDSVLNFLDLNQRAQGGQIKSLIDINIIKNNSWDIYAFEGNTVFDKQLSAIKQDIELKYKKYKIFLYNSTLAWTYNGKIDFYVDTVNTNNNFWGSSINEKHPDVVRSNKTKINLPCVDIAGIINKYDVDDVIVVKIDIEGAEYDLIVDFIKKDALKLIDYIAVEFHTYLSPYKTADDLFLKIMTLNNIKFANWSR